MTTSLVPWFSLTAPAMEAPAYFCIRHASTQSGEISRGLGGLQEVSTKLAGGLQLHEVYFDSPCD